MGNAEVWQEAKTGSVPKMQPHLRKHKARIRPLPEGRQGMGTSEAD